MLHNENKQLYVITAIFNPFGFESRYRLYWNFLKEMEQFGVKVFTVEAAFAHKDFRVTKPDNEFNLQLRTDQILWHKERLLNLGFEALKKVVPDCAFIGMFDADVTFCDPDWVKETILKLHTTQVVQPWGQNASLDGNEEILFTCPSTLKSFITGRGYHQHPPLPPSYTYKGHPGLAWCYQRETLDRLGGLYDQCIAGSADSIMANAFKGDWTIYLPGMPSEAMKASIAQYAANVDRVVHGNIGYTNGLLLHHWHGKSEQRGYEKRWSILSFHKFNPKVDLIMEPNGLWKWAGNKPQLEDDIKLSLSQRNEDA